MKRTLLMLAAVCCLVGANATTYYVSPEGGSRSDGLSPQTPKKDIQKALDAAEDGDVIRVAEGNYLGALDCGYIEIKKYITLQGGWNTSFTECNPKKYITKIEPGHEQDGTNGARGYITMDIAGQPHGKITIDGFVLNMGYQNNYKPANPADPANGCPEGAETGRALETSQGNVAHQLMRGNVEGDLTVKNCLFLNGDYFGIQMNIKKGNWEIANNLFVNCVYAACRIDGWQKDGLDSHVDFHHNTVLFSWCRTKTMEDMGYGYEMMARVDVDVHHCIFACSNYAAIARVHADSNKEIDKRRKTSAYDNYYFLNKCDLLLPAPGGGTWTYVMARQFEDVDEAVLRNIDNNRDLPQGDAFVNAIDPIFLKAYASLKKTESTTYNPNSAANQYRSSLGLNQQGTEIVRVNIYANRYSLNQALRLWGAKAGYGAQ